MKPRDWEKDRRMMQLLRYAAWRAVSEKGECSDNVKPGDAWYEEGAYPLISTVDDGLKTTFLRGMVLPPEYTEYPDTAMWIEGVPAEKTGWTDVEVPHRRDSGKA